MTDTRTVIELLNPPSRDEKAWNLFTQSERQYSLNEAKKSLFNTARDCYGGALESRMVARMETEGRDLTDEETKAEVEYILETIDYSGREPKDIAQVKKACKYVLKKYQEVDR